MEFVNPDRLFSGLVGVSPSRTVHYGLHQRPLHAIICWSELCSLLGILQYRTGTWQSISKRFVPSASGLRQIFLVADEGPELPTRSAEEFRPFIRRLPEFKFWLSATKATVVALSMAFFEVFNIPVFWPILVVYFILLFCLTMKRQIKVREFVEIVGCIWESVFQHMIKYRYLPFSLGKPKYAGRDNHSVQSH